MLPRKNVVVRRREPEVPARLLCRLRRVVNRSLNAVKKGELRKKKKRMRSRSSSTSSSDRSRHKRPKPHISSKKQKSANEISVLLKLVQAI